jgi:hypothetical protein
MQINIPEKMKVVVSHKRLLPLTMQKEGREISGLSEQGSGSLGYLLVHVFTHSLCRQTN